MHDHKPYAIHSFDPPYVDSDRVCIGFLPILSYTNAVDHWQRTIHQGSLSTAALSHTPGSGTRTRKRGVKRGGLNLMGMFQNLKKWYELIIFLDIFCTLLSCLSVAHFWAIIISEGGRRLLEVSEQPRVQGLVIDCIQQLALGFASSQSQPLQWRRSFFSSW